MEDFAKFLFSRGAVKIASSQSQCMRLKSGRLSPIFVNMGSLIDGEAIHLLAIAYADKIASLVKKGELEDFDYIFGPAYKGIPLGATVCSALYEKHGMNKKFLYDRKEAKAHGDVSADKLIVGANQFVKFGKILMIDDVITTGKAKFEAWEKIKSVFEYPRLVGIMVALDRQECGGDDKEKSASAQEEIREKLGCRLYSILTMGELYAEIAQSIDSEARQAWKDYFAKWGTQDAQKWAGKG